MRWNLREKSWWWRGLWLWPRHWWMCCTLLTLIFVHKPGHLRLPVREAHAPETEISSLTFLLPGLLLRLLHIGEDHSLKPYPYRQQKQTGVSALLYSGLGACP